MANYSLFYAESAVNQPQNSTNKTVFFCNFQFYILWCTNV